MKRIKVIDCRYCIAGEQDLFETGAEILERFPNADKGMYHDNAAIMRLTKSQSDFVGFVLSDNHTEECPVLIPLWDDEVDKFEIIE